MDLMTWLAYIGVITVLIAIPGPSSLLITLHGYQHGFKKTNYTIIGNLIGSLVLMGLSAAGLSIILTSSELLFAIAKYTGTFYLIVLGIKTWTKSSHQINVQSHQQHGDNSNIQLLKQGLLTGISNPKDLLFFTALFPAFLTSTGVLSTQLSILMLTWLLVDYMLKVIYMFAGKKISLQFSNANFLLLFNRCSGGLFVFFGIALASTSRT